jgi:hypothetical protein
MAVNAAWKNGVPARLLTILAANEMAASDWGDIAAFADQHGIGKSWGPLQINAMTAKGMAKNNAETTHEFLNQPGNNFDMGGRLLNQYLARLASDVASDKYASYSSSFKHLASLDRPHSQIFSDLKIIHEGDPRKIFALKPSAGLVSALAAMWNNGPGILHQDEIQQSAENAWAHSQNAASLFDHIEDFMPTLIRSKNVKEP